MYSNNNLSNPLEVATEKLNHDKGSTIWPSKRACNPISDTIQQTHFQAEMVIFSQNLTNIDLQPLTKACLLVEVTKFMGNSSDLYPKLASSNISGLDKVINDLYNVFLQHSAEIEKYFYHASRNSHYYTSVCLLIKILASFKTRISDTGWIQNTSTDSNWLTDLNENLLKNIALSSQSYTQFFMIIEILKSFDNLILTLPAKNTSINNPESSTFNMNTSNRKPNSHHFLSHPTQIKRLPVIDELDESKTLDANPKKRFASGL